MSTVAEREPVTGFGDRVMDGSMVAPIRVVAADDSYMIREFLTTILASAPEIDLLAVCSDARELQVAIETGSRPAIENVAHGGSVIDPVVVDVLIQARSRAARSRLGKLTPREREILAGIAAGKSNGAIPNRSSSPSERSRSTSTRSSPSSTCLRHRTSADVSPLH